MKTFKTISFFSLVLIFVSSLFQCSSVPKLEKEAPTTIETVYFQKWNAGTQEGGSGIDVYIKIKEPIMSFDSIYFRERVAKLHANSNDDLMNVGRFKSNVKDSNKESVETIFSSFQLKDNECVVSYTLNQKVHYFKISNLNERQTINYPSASSNEL